MAIPMNQTQVATDVLKLPPGTLRDVQIERARRSFIYFCNSFCFVLSGDADATWVPFHLWPEQTKVAEAFQRERLLAILKARQLGMTWLAVAYALWSKIFCPIATVLLFSRRDDEAVEIKGRLAGMYRHLPSWLKARFPIEKDNDHEFALQNGSRALAFPTNAGDSYTGTLAIVDEADLIPDLGKLMRSVKPTIDGGGKLFLLSRVDKFQPDSPFKRIYRGAKEGKTQWKAIFLPWSAKPSRDDAWYEETQAEVLHRTHNLDEMAEQYPATDDEALAPPNYGGRFKADWFRYYTPADASGNHWQFGDKKYHKDTIKRRFLTVDPATSVKETAKDDPDWTVISSWGKTECGYLVWLGCLRLRVEGPDIYPAIGREYVRWNAGKAIVEGGGMQKAVPQTARRHQLPDGTYMNIITYNPGGQDKLDRAQAMLNMAQAGRIWLPLNVDPEFPLAEVKSELLRFTGDPKKQVHDDIWDTLSMAGNEVTIGSTVRHIIRGSGAGVAREGFKWQGYERS
jgi:phage terminase large subunit-like protein